MKLAERDKLIQTLLDRVSTLEKQWYETRDSIIWYLLNKVREELYKAKDIPLTPEIGMGATGGCGSDCYPYTVVWVSKDGKKIEVTDDTHTPAPGHDYYANQLYTYTSNMEGHRTRYRLRKNGRWVKDGEPMRGGASITLGHRRYYQDPSF